MILVDASVSIDHLGAASGTLVGLLESGEVLAHPFVIGEIALGDLRQRDVSRTLSRPPAAAVAMDAEVLRFIDRDGLFGRCLGYLTPGPFYRE